MGDGSDTERVVKAPPGWEPGAPPAVAPGRSVGVGPAVPPWGAPGARPIAPPVEVAGAGPGERRWDLDPGTHRFETVFIGGFLLVVAPIEAALAWFTASAVSSPFGAELADGYPDDWLALPLTTVTAVPLVLVTWVGARGVRHLWRGDRGSVVVIGRRGIRHVRRSRRGRDREIADLAWHEIGDVAESHEWVKARTIRGEAWLAQDGTAQERREIAESVRERLAASWERPPVIPGRVAYLDDQGATITEERDRRRRWSRWTGGGAALATADAAAFASATGVDGGWWLLAASSAAIAAGLGFGTYRLARHVPRWTSRPGTVVLVTGQGRRPVFTGTALWLLDERDPEGNVTGRLVAVDGSGMRRVVLRSGRDTVWLAEAGRWLAHHAGIELQDQRRYANDP